jgi:hypothetical protein
MSYQDLLDRAIGDTEPPSTVDVDRLIVRERRRRRRWAVSAGSAAVLALLVAAGVSLAPGPGATPVGPAVGADRDPALRQVDAAVWAALSEHAPGLGWVTWNVPEDESWSPADGPLWVSRLSGGAAGAGAGPYRGVVTSRADWLRDHGADPVYVATALIPVGQRIDVLDVTIARIGPASSLDDLDCEANTDILNGTSFACEVTVGSGGERIRSAHNAGPFDVEAIPVQPRDRQVQVVVVRPDGIRVDVWARILVYDERAPSLPPLDLNQAEAVALDARLSLPAR